MKPERIADITINPKLRTLPPKFVELADWQIPAIHNVCEAFFSGVKVVVLDAPTGSGKTVIAECVRRILDTRAVYVCHNKDLQLQFSGDFPYSRVMWGRDNYIPTNRVGDETCGDCTYQPGRASCVLCRDRESCPYQVAKTAAIHSPVPVLNSAYWLTETQSPKSRFANTGLVVFDEADTLEHALMSQVEVYLSERAQGIYQISPPHKLTVADSYLRWGETALRILEPKVKRLMAKDIPDVRQIREAKRLLNLVETITGMIEDLNNGVPWVYTGGAGSDRRRGNAISFRPVKVDRFGAARIWGRDKRFLLMSGSVVSPKLLVESLGWTSRFHYVTVDSQFHPKNRQVVVKPVASVTRRGLDGPGRDKLRIGVAATLLRHEGERCLIHTVSYNLTNDVLPYVQECRRGRVFSYGDSRSRADAVRGYIQTDAAVLVAPSVDRGIDLPDELCRVQIILKVPYLNLGDKQVSERLYKTADGKIWYNVHVARTIMQMVGRGVRGVEDHCVCYVLDESFVGWYRAWGHLFPRWFVKGIRFEC